MKNLTRTKMYVENADFENGLGSPICGWQSYYGKRRPQGNQVITKEESYQGEKCLKIWEKGMVYSDTVLGIKSGYTYTASAMIKAETEAEFLIKFYDVSTAEFFTETVTVSAEKEWKYVEASAMAPSGAVFARILVNAKEDGNVYVDDVNMYEEPFLNDKNEANVMSGIEYALFADCIENGEISLEFKDLSGVTLNETNIYCLKGENTLIKAFAPENATKAVIKTDENNFENLKIYPVAYGTQIPDNKFETLENNLTGIWEKTGNKLVSSPVPVESGKSYVIVCNAKPAKAGNAKMTITYYNFKGEFIEEGKAAVVSKGVGDEKLSLSSVAPSFAYYAFIELEGIEETEFKGIELYTISNSVSNASFESVNQHYVYNPLVGEDGATKAEAKGEEVSYELAKPRGKNGNFPLGWRRSGDVFAMPVSDAELDAKFGAMRLSVQGFGEGSIYSSMIAVESQKSYTAGILAKGKTGGFCLSFFDEDFNCLAKSDKVCFSFENYKKYVVSEISPKEAVYAALELLATEGDNFFVDNAELYPSVLEVKNRTQMFIDDYFIDKTDMNRTFHTPEKTEPIMGESDDYWEKHGAYVYGTILYDKEEKLYKMWYQATNHDDISGGDATSVMAAYATSYDAVNWEKPNLGIMEYPVSEDRKKTSKDNNLIGNAHMHNMSVFVDYNDVPEKKFKMITYNKEPVPGKRLGRGYYIWRYSADGVNWYDGGNVTKGLDVITAAPSSDGKYFGVLKNVQTRRDQWTIVGNTVDSWEVPVPAKSLADIIDAKNYFRSDSYGMGLYEKDGVYIGINWLMNIPGKATYEGKIVPMLAFSRDLKEEWQRPSRDAIIPLGEQGNIDCGQIYTASYAMEMGDEVWMYCGVWNDDHLVHDREARIYIAKWRMDGFASLSSGKEECTLKTKPFVLCGSKLCVNANATNGSMYVELLNDKGEPISGFTKADCDEISGDSTKHIVSWNGKSDISKLSGQTMSLRVYSEESELYSIKFEN